MASFQVKILENKDRKSDQFSGKNTCSSRHTFQFQGVHYQKEYIAAQGPKGETVHDFWRMVLQHESESIIMLTSLEEDGRNKCFKYYPDLNKDLVTDNITVTCTNEIVTDIYVKKIMMVKRVSFLCGNPDQPIINERFYRKTINTKSTTITSRNGRIMDVPSAHVT